MAPVLSLTRIKPMLVLAVIVASGIAATWLRQRSLPQAPAEEH